MSVYREIDAMVRDGELARTARGYVAGHQRDKRSTGGEAESRKGRNNERTSESKGKARKRQPNKALLDNLLVDGEGSLSHS